MAGTAGMLRCDEDLFRSLRCDGVAAKGPQTGRWAGRCPRSLLRTFRGSLRSHLKERWWLACVVAEVRRRSLEVGTSRTGNGPQMTRLLRCDFRSLRCDGVAAKGLRAGRWAGTCPGVTVEDLSRLTSFAPQGAVVGSLARSLLRTFRGSPAWLLRCDEGASKCAPQSGGGPSRSIRGDRYTCAPWRWTADLYARRDAARPHEEMSWSVSGDAALSHLGQDPFVISSYLSHPKL